MSALNCGHRHAYDFAKSSTHSVTWLIHTSAATCLFLIVSFGAVKPAPGRTDCGCVLRCSSAPNRLLMHSINAARSKGNGSTYPMPVKAIQCVHTLTSFIVSRIMLSFTWASMSLSTPIDGLLFTWGRVRLRLNLQRWFTPQSTRA